MITPDGFFDWAERMSGPAHKVWPETNTLEAVVFHSAVGSLQGVVNVVMGLAQKSVTGVVGYDGGFVQFYPVTASPWANGSHEFNRRYLGFEFEGGADTPETVSEPLTTAQVDAAVHILRDLAGWKNVSPTYWERPWTLKEHRELVATACPSGRIPWDAILAQLKGEPVAEPTQEQLRGMVVEAVVNKYLLVKLGENAVGEWVVEAHELDGKTADPPIVFAVLPPGRRR